MLLIIQEKTGSNIKEMLGRRSTDIEIFIYFNDNQLSDQDSTSAATKFVINLLPMIIVPPDISNSITMHVFILKAILWEYINIWFQSRIRDTIVMLFNPI